MLGCVQVVRSLGWREGREEVGGLWLCEGEVASQNVVASSPMTDTLIEEMSSWDERVSGVDVASAAAMTLDRERGTVRGAEVLQGVEHRRGLDLVTEVILESGKVSETGTMNGSVRQALVEMMSCRAMVVMVQRRDMAQEVITITVIRTVVTIDLRRNMSEVLIETETMTLAGQVMLVQGKEQLVTEQAMSMSMILIVERDMAATEEDLAVVVARVLVEVEMTMLAEGRMTTGVAEAALVVIGLNLLVAGRALGVDVVVTVTIGRSLLAVGKVLVVIGLSLLAVERILVAVVVEKVLVVAEGSVRSDWRNMTPRETDILVLRKDLVRRE